jgi:hypothetical protein
MGARRPRPPRAGFAATAVAIVLLVACSSGGSGSGASSTTSAPTTASTTTSATSTSASGPSACPTSGLAVSLTGPEGTAGHLEFQLAFRNTTAVTCTLTGFPGVSFVDADGTQLGVPVPRSSLPTTTVSVGAGATVTAHLQVTDPGVLDCPPSSPAGLRVYPPGQTASVTVPLSGVAVCVSQPGAIDPVVTTAG